MVQHVILGAKVHKAVAALAQGASEVLLVVVRKQGIRVHVAVVAELTHGVQCHMHLEIFKGVGLQLCGEARVSLARCRAHCSAARMNHELWGSSDVQHQA